MLLTVYVSSLLLKILLFCPEADSAVTAFTSRPSNPVFVEETHDVILVWNYTLDGTVAIAKFLNTTGGVSDEIARQFQGSMTVHSSYQERFRADMSDTQARLTILKVQRSDKGKYEVDLTASVSGTLRHTVEMIVWFQAKLTDVSDLQMVPENSSVQLFCKGSGSPGPNITWTRLFDNRTESGVLNRSIGQATLDFANRISRDDAGTYLCTAYNGIGNPDNQTTIVTVSYPPEITNLPAVYKVAVQGSVSLHCKAVGIPLPSFAWAPCDPQENVCNKSWLNVSQVVDDGVYTCTGKNTLGSDSGNASVVIAGREINVTLVITSLSCVDGKYNQSSMLSKKLNETISKLFVNQSAYLGTILRNVRCGSLIVDLTLEFSNIVTEKSVLTILQEATKDGKLGEFSVNSSSIIGTRPVIASTTIPPISRTTPTVSDSDKTWVIVGAVLGSVAALAIIAGVAFYCVHKKKKNGGKGTKEVADDEAAGQRNRGGPAPAAHGLNNSGYVATRSASGYANPSGLPPVKPGSRKENKQEKKGKEQNETNEQQALPLYAQVDKSKKTPKPPLNTYDQVERSRKSQPGEVMYTQVEQVNPGGSMPRAAASPVRRPPAYDDTQYAELII